ncbi:aldose 1-epimerase family protein [Pseudoramibacter alactolyticus]
MDTRLIENEYLQAEISDVGAEPVFLWDKGARRNVLWRGDDHFWGRHAPVLFPNVGRHFGDVFRHKGQVYSLSQHGFARDRVFTCVAEQSNSLSLQLVSDDATRENYPFPFVLTVTHQAVGHQLVTIWQVRNTGNEPMYFTIGGHPAFVLLKNDLAMDHYYLKIEGSGAEGLTVVRIDPKAGNPLPGVTEDWALTDGRLPLTDALFEADVVILDNHQIDRISLVHNSGDRLVTVDAGGFPNFGIWSKPGAPFVCLEPWVGRTDDAGFTGELSEKPGIITLDAGETFEARYAIEL